MSSGKVSDQISHRQPFLSALDYIFYIELHIQKLMVQCNPLNESFQIIHQNNEQVPNLNEILKKLELDLQSAFDLFVNDFVENNGIHSLLNLLRLCLNRQQCPETIKTDIPEEKDKFNKNKERQQFLKSSLTHEYGCLVCMKWAINRSYRALQKMISHKPGLSCLSACIVSNLTKSRIIALQILTHVCDQTEGVNKVLEAMSTMRIFFGESVRFKFLVSMINSGNSCSPNSIECNALSLLNTLLHKTINFAERIRLQCEFEEAGLDIDFLEKVLIENKIPMTEMIWTEIQRFRKQYINLNDKYVERQQIVVKDELKEEVQILHRALNKLEEDKINLMTIERELKEKCEDLEQEVDHLKSKFNILIPIESKKPTNSLLSNNGSKDIKSIDFISEKSERIQSKDRLTENKNHFNCDQNVRNEEEFIYVPAILPPPNFAHYMERENPVNDRTVSKNQFIGKKDSVQQNRQLQINSEKRDLISNNKPLVVDVLPKYKFNQQMKQKMVGSALNTDRDNYETILRWNYSLNSETDSKTNTKYISPKNISISMNHINSSIEDNFMFDTNPQNSNINSHSYNNISSDKLLKSYPNGFAKSNDCLYSGNHKKINIRSSLQSYFFSGCSTFKQNKKPFQSHHNIGDSPKSFPLPKTYRKNFILKGHGNCGLYSGDLDPTDSSKNLSDDLKSAPHFDETKYT